MKALTLTVAAMVGGAGPIAAQTDQPPLIDRNLFFGEIAISGAQISPDGRFLIPALDPMHPAIPEVPSGPSTPASEHAPGGGGGTILPQEISELHKYGITKIYSPDDGRKMGLEGMIEDRGRDTAGSGPGAADRPGPRTTVAGCEVCAQL